MVFKWKWNENEAVVRILLSKEIKKGLILVLKNEDNYSNTNEYTLGKLLDEAWDMFKIRHTLPNKNNAKRELVDVEINKKMASEIADWATKWGLFQIVLKEYIDEKLLEQDSIPSVIEIKENLPYKDRKQLQYKNINE